MLGFQYVWLTNRYKYKGVDGLQPFKIAKFLEEKLTPKVIWSYCLVDSQPTFYPTWQISLAFLSTKVPECFACLKQTLCLLGCFFIEDTNNL